MNALTTPNKTLFLSYSRKQTAWCDDLYTAIDTYTHFQRWRDNKIPESADWWDSICVNIEGCFAFVAILTPDYLASVYCMGELEYALKLQKPVIALTLGEVNYPAKLNELRLQFARVGGLDMPQVINKVLSACTQIMQGYMQDDFSTDIHPRKHLRPRVPTPHTAAQTPEEDTTLNQQIDAVSVHGQIPTRDLIRRFNEEKGYNPRLARDLLEKIKRRPDVSVFFDVKKEDADLKAAEIRHSEAEKQRQRLKKIREEYEDLAQYTMTMNKAAASKAVRRFFTTYPQYPDIEALRRKFFTLSVDLMPVPFAWMEIPGGYGTMRVNSFNLSLKIPRENYCISKYPITNAQYDKFMEAGGYREERWWTPYGWIARQEHDWTEPRFWQDTKWNGSEQPVIGVSWFEAVAFCLWLSETTGETIMLPTESQWQYAARGKDGREYPWGNKWDATRCNNSDTGGFLGFFKSKPVGHGQSTTPVTAYEGKGDSPFGVVDMAGNVREWCLTDYDTRTDDVNSAATRRVLRGGSWFDNLVFARAAYRDCSSPYSRNFNFGFRVVLLFPPSHGH